MYYDYFMTIYVYVSEDKCITNSAYKPLFTSVSTIPVHYSNKMSTQLPETQKVVLIEGVSEDYDVIKYTDFATPKIEGPNEIIVKNFYAGVNFIEAYFRKGYYPITFPAVLGREACGEVVAVGSGISKFKVGDKVVYTSGKTFAQYTKINDSHLTVSKIADETTDDELKLYGSFLIQTLTAYTFTEEPYAPKPEDYVLVWAAAGGVGSIMTQILNNRGVKVIALASTDDKLALAKEQGAAYTINYKTENVVERVKVITNGKGVKVSYDSVGKATWQTSIDSLQVGGILVSYGNSSGKVPPISIYSLTPKNLVILRPNCGNYITSNEKWEYYFGKIIGDYKLGSVKYSPPAVHELKEYAEVAKVLESGATTGKSVLKID